MERFVEGADRGQSTLFPECLNSIRVIDVFVDELDLGELGFGGIDRSSPVFYNFFDLFSKPPSDCACIIGQDGQDRGRF